MRIAAIVLAVIALGLVLYLMADYGHAIQQRTGRVLIALGVFLLPSGAALTGLGAAMEKSKDTRFCLGCHEMQPYARSLAVDDEEYIAATHVQRGLVPRERACFTCHTDYGWFGDLKAKLGGLRHAAVHFSGRIPDVIELYNPYPNANCLHCHESTRAFLGVRQHAKVEGGFDGLRRGAPSCVDSGCHDVVHDVRSLDEATLWTPTEAQP